MIASLRECEHLSTATEQRIQINTSPNDAAWDFSPLAGHAQDPVSIDLVSIADILRNGFVYEPHTIYKDVKIAATGFDPSHDMFDQPRFHYLFQPALGPARPPLDAVHGDQLLETYHRLLCDAVARSTTGMRAPWLLQSGGKDSTSMAIAMADVRPDTICITYLGGNEENEVASARFVARKLGLRHETLICDPGRAYDRYLAMLPRMPLLTADFATLSYVDLATEIRLQQGDGLIDALGSDQYFGVPLHWQDRVLALLARNLQVPQQLFQSRLVSRHFKLCVVLATLGMSRFERYFPGSRFSDAEADALLGCPVAQQSRRRVEVFQADLDAAGSAEAIRRLSLVIGESAHLAKGMYSAAAMSLRLAYPYADPRFRDWVFTDVPDELLIGPGGLNKVLMRRYIDQYFHDLPYVKAKGCFRFDLRGLARQRFEQVYDFAQQMQALLPGAPHWLESHRDRLDNKFFASKFYLLAMTLPWLHSRMRRASAIDTSPGAEVVAP
ncbi:MAG TPA: asparagine synthase-related protein [Dyella sp.]|uniref:asparagine synthase-related protein n=1 Tax=Dyella sp. TaxID=1869338 RepID=UPI002B583AF1|nr:asparagine synthase-related protein [Dyella sp.]HUB89685.1 asparagine synthase-related protein [Dyella sp.]